MKLVSKHNRDRYTLHLLFCESRLVYLGTYFSISGKRKSIYIYLFFSLHDFGLDLDIGVTKSRVYYLDRLYREI